jgi:ABC-2 type transport system permease protein
MQAELGVGRPASEGRWPATVVARQTAHKAVRSGVLWGYVFGAYLATQALAYASSYKTVSQRAGIAKEFGANAGISALVGPAHELQTVAGFTVWKCLAVLAVVGAVWGLLTGTRLLRGEEDAGRWELLLAGQTTRRAAAAQALAGLGCGVAALWVVTAVITAVRRRSTSVSAARCSWPSLLSRQRQCSSQSERSPANWRPRAAKRPRTPARLSV